LGVRDTERPQTSPKKTFRKKTVMRTLEHRFLNGGSQEVGGEKAILLKLGPRGTEKTSSQNRPNPRRRKTLPRKNGIGFRCTKRGDKKSGKNPLTGVVANSRKWGTLQSCVWRQGTRSKVRGGVQIICTVKEGVTKKIWPNFFCERKQKKKEGLYVKYPSRKCGVDGDKFQGKQWGGWGVFHIQGRLVTGGIKV